MWPKGETLEESCLKQQPESPFMMVNESTRLFLVEDGLLFRKSIAEP